MIAIWMMTEGIVGIIFVKWLCDKWKRGGEKRVTVKINRRYYEFDQDQLTKAIEEAIEICDDARHVN